MNMIRGLLQYLIPSFRVGMTWNSNLYDAPQDRMIRIRYASGMEGDARRRGPLFFPDDGPHYTYATVVEWRELSDSEVKAARHRHVAALNAQIADHLDEIARLEGKS